MVIGGAYDLSAVKENILMMPMWEYRHIVLILYDG